MVFNVLLPLGPRCPGNPLSPLIPSVHTPSLPGQPGGPGGPGGPGQPEFPAAPPGPGGPQGPGEPFSPVVPEEMTGGIYFFSFSSDSDLDSESHQQTYQVYLSFPLGPGVRFQELGKQNGPVTTETPTTTLAYKLRLRPITVHFNFIPPPMAPFSPGGPGIPSCPWFPLGPAGPGSPGAPLLPVKEVFFHQCFSWSVSEKKNMKWLQTASLMSSKCAKCSLSNTSD